MYSVRGMTVFSFGFPLSVFYLFAIIISLTWQFYNPAISQVQWLSSISLSHLYTERLRSDHYSNYPPPKHPSLKFSSLPLIWCSYQMLLSQNDCSSSNLHSHMASSPLLSFNFLIITLVVYICHVKQVGWQLGLFIFLIWARIFIAHIT